MAINAQPKSDIAENDHDWKRLTPKELERIRLSGLDVTEQYGESYKLFDWSYWIIASPVPSKMGTRTRASRGKSDDAIKEMLASTFRKLTTDERNEASRTEGPAAESVKIRPVRYAYCLETGSGGWRHAHVLLGGVSRLDPFQIEAAFKANQFGYVLVRVWNKRIENGYPFKSLAPSASDHHEAYPESNVTWNRKCQQEMKLHRKHLLELVGPDATNERKPVCTSTLGALASR